MQKKKLSLALGTSALFAVLTSTVYASGFQVFETNGSGLGNAFAGGAAIADDASTEFDNPAGIVRIQSSELDFGGVMVLAHAKFNEDSITMNPLFTAPLHPLLVDLYPTGVKSVNPLGLNVLPSLHFTMPLFSKLYFGFGLTIPYGYFTDYTNASIASSFATKSKVENLNINPSLAYQVTDKLSVGAGFDAQYLEAEMNRFVRLSVGSLLDPTKQYAQATLAADMKATDWGYGWNAGVLYQFTPATRVGVAFRSKVDHKPSGTLTADLAYNVFGVGGSWNSTSWANTSMVIPEMLTLSAYHDFNESIAAMATLSWTHWSRFEHLNVALLDATTQQAGTMNLYEGFHNTVRSSLGLNYKLNEHWKLRFGVAYDPSPVNDSNRTIQLPDGDRIWAATGAQYDFNHYVSVNAGYAHLFIRSGSLNYSDPMLGKITGHYDHSYANLFGLQINVKFE